MPNGVPRARDRSHVRTHDRLLEISAQIPNPGMVRRQHALLGQEIKTRRGIDLTQSLFGQSRRDNGFPIGRDPGIDDDAQSGVGPLHPAESDLLEKLDQRIGLRNGGDGSVHQVVGVSHASSWSRLQVLSGRRNFRRHLHPTAPNLPSLRHQTRRIVFQVS